MAGLLSCSSDEGPTRDPLASPVVTVGDALEGTASVGPPAGSPIEFVRRDCGFSVPFDDETTMWVFCDTTQWDPDGRLQWFVASSAALATSQEPMVLHDALDGGRPRVFIEPGPDRTPCDDRSRETVWPMSGVALPGPDGTERVLVYYLNVCLVPGGAEGFDIGLAELTYDPGSELDALPLRAEVLEPHLFPRLGEGGSYGVAAVADDEFVYAYWCDQGEGPCTVARVAHDAAADLEAYRYWDGNGWIESMDGAVPMSLPDPLARIKPSVTWVDALGLYVLVDVDGFNQVDVRFSERPQGPWSDRAVQALPGCDAAFPDICFAAEVHAHLSTAESIAVTYFDPSRPLGLEQPTRLVEIPVMIEARD